MDDWIKMIDDAFRTYFSTLHLTTLVVMAEQTTPTFKLVLGKYDMNDTVCTANNSSLSLSLSSL
jgi:hypothetical protein